MMEMSSLEVFFNWVLYKLTFLFHFIQLISTLFTIEPSHTYQVVQYWDLCYIPYISSTDQSCVQAWIIWSDSARLLFSLGRSISTRPIFRLRPAHFPAEIAGLACFCDFAEAGCLLPL